MADTDYSDMLKAYDEFLKTQQKFNEELKKVLQIQDQADQGFGRLKKSVLAFGQAMGELGALKFFQDGLKEIIKTGSEFELAIKHAQVTTGDFSGAFRDMAMSGLGGKIDTHGPIELTKAFTELGQAGAGTNQIMSATPDVLEFGTASMLDTAEAARAVMAAAGSFNISLEDSQKIVDAYTTAMNRSALTGKDFEILLGSAGAAAKMAGQDFRQLLTIGAVMRDAGMSSQAAGASIKSALTSMLNPSREAKAVMKDLGIDIYDAGGKMKQWSDITAEFERGLAPLNEQSRMFALNTVLGSDGMQAMALSLNRGSGYLQEFNIGLANSNGATERAASALGDTFDGAIRRTNASLERAKILLFEDFANGTVGFIESINTLLVGFNNVDEGTRRLIELLIGSMGLAVALGTIASTIRIVAIPMLRALGITASAALGPWGLLIAGVTTLASIFLGARVAEAGARVETENHNRTVIATGESYLRLNEKFQKTKQDTAEYNSLQGQTNSALQQLAQQMPEVITQWDSEGNAIAANNELLREKIRLTKEAMMEAANREAADVQQNYNITVKQINDLENERAALKEKYKGLDEELAKLPKDYNSQIPAIDSRRELDPDLIKADKEAQLKVISEQIDAKLAEADKLREKANRQYAILYGNSGSTDAGASIPIPKTIHDVANVAGNLSYTASPGSSGNNYDDEAARRYEESRKWIENKKALDDLSAADEVAAWERVAARYAEGTEQKMQADIALHQAKKRLADEEKQQTEDAYQQAMNLMRHQVNMGRISVDGQIEQLQKLQNAHKWTQQQAWNIEEELFQLRRQQLSGYLNSLEDQYKEKLDAIDQRTKKNIRNIQDQIDALEEEGKSSNRDDAVRKHNETIADLQEKRRYHELRTGKEHTEAIAELDKEIAEERQDFEKQQQEWVREDKKQNLQKQLEDARKAGEEERKNVEEHYRKVVDLANKGALDTLAALATKDPQFLQTGMNWLKNLMDGVDLMGPAFEAKLQQYMSVLDGYEGQLSAGGSDKTSSAGGIQTGGSSTMSWQEKLEYYKTHGSEALNEIARAGTVYNQALSAGNIEGARAAHKWADQIRKAIGQPMIWDENTESSPAVHNSYAKGGPILYDQIAQLHAGEYVVPTSLVDAIRRNSAPQGMVGKGVFESTAIDRAADRIVAAIEKRKAINISNLLNIEHFENTDRTDPEMLARDIRRAVAAISGAKG